MIDREDSGFALVCDICGEGPLETFFAFHNAVNHKKLNGWKSQKRSGEWEDVCPDCQAAVPVGGR